jgi:hypothetical protein
MHWPVGGNSAETWRAISAVMRRRRGVQVREHERTDQVVLLCPATGRARLPDFITQVYRAAFMAQDFPGCKFASPDRAHDHPEHGYRCSQGRESSDKSRARSDEQGHGVNETGGSAEEGGQRQGIIIPVASCQNLDRSRFHHITDGAAITSDDPPSPTM